MTNMKKLIAISAALLLTSAALAGFDGGPSYRVKMGGSNAGNTGGSFDATTLNDMPAATGNWADLGYAIGDLFKTFCVENVTFSPGSSYWASVNDTIELQGGAPKQLTAGTQNLYARYIADESFGANIGKIDSALDETLLQAYFWLDEGAYANVASLPSAHKNAVNGSPTLWADILASAAIPHANASAVKVMNLWTGWTLVDGFTGDAQSQLIIVPLPGAALLGVLGLGAVAWIRRK